MPVLHKNINAEIDIHVPKWMPSANVGDVAWKNELGELEATDELVLPAALNFVDASVAPPTTNAGDIYVLSSGGSVNAGWGSVALKDWVRYDGTTWNEVTPQKSTLCYDETLDVLMAYDGADWQQVGASLYATDGTLTGDRIVSLDGNTLTFDAGDALLGGVIIDGSSYTGSEDPVFRVIGVGTGNTFSINEDGFIGNDSITGNNVLKLYNTTGDAGIELTNGVSRLYIDTFFIKNSTSATGQMRMFHDSTAVSTQWEESSGATLEHWIRSGNFRAAHFFRSGVSNEGFIVGNSSMISTENISLQDDTMIARSSDSIGFYGTTPVAKQTVTGSRGGNAALTDLLTKLATLGIITDSTT